MHAVITEKVSGGKLIRIKLTAARKIEALQISGDFFLHPEEALDALERSLIGVPVRTGEAALAERIDALLRSQGAEFLGLTPADLARVIHNALQSKENP